ncbi:MAG: ankyrin repeat domain-containing protein [Puniceicoccales bacterium]|jgi:hypothetical protein|nr:ankyrin repeat domain-containing protein [Puniceicoccales bacterium]
MVQKNIIKIGKKLIAVSLLWNSLSLMGSGRGIFNHRGVVNRDTEEFLDFLKRKDIQSASFRLDANMIDVENLFFGEERNTLIMEIIKAAILNFITPQDACTLVRPIIVKHREILNNRNTIGKNALDFAIQSKYVDLIKILLSNPMLRFSTNYMNAFIDIAICFRELELLEKAFKRGLEKSQTLKSVQEKLVAILRHIAGGSQAYCTLAMNCSNVMVFITNQIVYETTTRNERELIDAIMELVVVDGNEAELGEKVAEIYGLLNKDGLNINYQDEIGRTPLMWAAAMGHEDVVCAVLGKGPNRNICDDEGKTALDIARNNNQSRIIALLQE